MKNVLILLMLLGCLMTMNSQTISAKDSLEINAKINDWNQGWNIKDATLASKWYSSDAEFTNAFGFNMIGRSAIESYLTGVFKMDFIMDGSSVQTFLKLKYISDNVILAISNIERKGQKLSDGKELATRQTTHHRLFKKTDNWYIISHLISDARSIKTDKH